MCERVVIRCHAIHRCHRAQGAGEVIGSAVAHDTDGAHRKDRDKGLPDFIIKPVLADLVDVDRIGLTQDFEFFAGDLARAANCEARAREGVAADEAVGQAKLAAELAHFVFEEAAQGLNKFKPHLFG